MLVVSRQNPLRFDGGDVPAGATIERCSQISLTDGVRAGVGTLVTSTVNSSLANLDNVSESFSTRNHLVDFLNKKRGFCQQFAGAFAVMAREVNLPSRVVVGFVPGDKQPDGSYSVTWHDAHAWPEVFFQGTGWVRFEPTPRSDNAGV